MNTDYLINRVDIIAFRLEKKINWLYNPTDTNDFVSRAIDRGKLSVNINDYPDCPPVYSA